MNEHKTSRYQRGDVFQIRESYGHKGWIGSFIMATEIKSFGIMGFVHCLVTHDESAQAYLRPKWEDLDYIGRALLVPEDIDDVEEP